MTEFCYVATLSLTAKASAEALRRKREGGYARRKKSVM